MHILSSWLKQPKTTKQKHTYLELQMETPSAPAVGVTSSVSSWSQEDNRDEENARYKNFLFTNKSALSNV